MRNIFTFWFIVIILILIISGCNERNISSLTSIENNDIIELDIDNNLNLEEDIIEEEEVLEPLVPDPCIECKMYFCPPLDAIWQKEICINICEDPPTVVSETECTEYFECDPGQYLMGQVECITPSGYPGTQDKVCNKGRIQYTQCVTDCTEEACNYIDDDCDELIDEGQLNACGECGVIPPEICDNVDNDCNGKTDEDLIQPCATACGTGYEMCSNGNWISCTADQPTEEICDGFDNDCDGQIDEELECVCTIQDVGTLFPCQESPLVCGEGFKTCECVDPGCTQILTTPCYALCHWFPPADPSTCDPTIGQIIQQEECNNFDENCNQLIDEDLYASCYTGPEGTLFNGICIPGVMTCNYGEWGSFMNEQFIPSYCQDEVTPQEEICDGIDNDCDGITDYGEEMKDTDILFIVDWSGSMDDEINAVLIALNQFAQYYSDEEVLQWSLIRGPLPVVDSLFEEHLELTHNLSGFTDFLSTMSNLNFTSGNGTSLEMLMDAVYLSIGNISGALPIPISDLQWKGIVNPTGFGNIVKESNPPIDQFIMNWRPGVDKIIIVITDEKEQSYLHPSITNQHLIDALTATPQLKLHTFTRFSFWQWDEISASTGGENFKLSSNPTEIYNSLMQILDEVCKSESQ